MSKKFKSQLKFNYKVSSHLQDGSLIIRKHQFIQEMEKTISLQG